MKLLQLSIKNFKGIKDYVLTTNGNDIEIYGDNATGKTTLFDAFIWLLFGKNSVGMSDFEIKPIDKNGIYLRNLETSVEAILDVNNEKITLKKVFKEKWQRKKGRELEFVGNETEHFVNDVPYKKNDFVKYISSIIQEDVFKLITNPLYFNENLDWKKRREILMKISSNIKDEDIISDNPFLADLKDIVKDKKIDDVKKIYSQKKTELIKQIESIPVRIEEVEKSIIPTEPSLTKETVTRKIDELTNIKNTLLKEIADIRNGGKIAELNKQKLTLEIEIYNIKKNLVDDVSKIVNTDKNKLHQMKLERDNTLREIENLKKQINTIEQEIKTTEIKIQEKRNEYLSVQAQKPEIPASQNMCPVCGQKMPSSIIEKTNQKYVEHFNLEKSEKLAKISVEGKNLKNQLEKIVQDKNKIEGILIEKQDFVKFSNVAIEDLETKIRIAEENAKDITKDQKYISLNEEIKRIDLEIKNIELATAKEISEKENALKDIESQIKQLYAELSNIEQNEKTAKRIEELGQLEKHLAKEIENVEYVLYLIDSFMKLKIDVVEKDINSKFKLVKFKLFDTLINGNESETCEATYDGVPYSSLNNGAKINVGLDIINTLCEHFNVTAPIFIDNAESITNIIKTEGQQIRLIVDKNYKELYVRSVENGNK